MADDDKELSVIFSDQVKDAMASDPEKAAAVQEFTALLHQTHAGVKSGQYASLDDALEKLTGSRPEMVDGLEDDE